MGFPPHLRRWLSIIVYLGVVYLLLGKIQISFHGKRQKPKGSIYNKKNSPMKIYPVTEIIKFPPQIG